jgi:hypothetical protein
MQVLLRDLGPSGSFRSSRPSAQPSDRPSDASLIAKVHSMIGGTPWASQGHHAHEGDASAAPPGAGGTSGTSTTAGGAVLLLGDHTWAGPGSHFVLQVVVGGGITASSAVPGAMPGFYRPAVPQTITAGSTGSIDDHRMSDGSLATEPSLNPHKHSTTSQGAAVDGTAVLHGIASAGTTVPPSTPAVQPSGLEQGGATSSRSNSNSGSLQGGLTHAAPKRSKSRLSNMGTSKDPMPSIHDLSPESDTQSQGATDIAPPPPPLALIQQPVASSLFALPPLSDTALDVLQNNDSSPEDAHGSQLPPQEETSYQPSPTPVSPASGLLGEDEGAAVLTAVLRSAMAGGSRGNSHNGSKKRLTVGFQDPSDSYSSSAPPFGLHPDVVRANADEAARFNVAAAAGSGDCARMGRGHALCSLNLLSY